jgi:hypothetical protein
MLLLAVFYSFFPPDPCSQSSSRSRVTHDFGNFHLLSSRRITCFLPFYLITWLILFDPQICVKVAFFSFSYIAFLFDQSDFRFASYLPNSNDALINIYLSDLLLADSWIFGINKEFAKR